MIFLTEENFTLSFRNLFFCVSRSVFLCGKVEKNVDNLLFHFFQLFHIEKFQNFHIFEKYVKIEHKLKKTVEKFIGYPQVIHKMWITLEKIGRK